MNNRTALVTGAAQGLGAAMAELFAREGARVAVCDVRESEARATATRIVDDGYKARAFRLDVTDAAEWRRAITDIAGWAGAPTVLVNNAGIIGRQSIVELAVEDWQRVLNVNLTGAFLGLKSCGPVMRDAGGGAIVNISSIAGLIAHFDPAYAATKWGVRGLTKCAALEFADWKIRVNSVHPAMVMTPLQESAPPGYSEASRRAIPLGRPARAEEVAQAALYLASDESSFVTGTELVVDGGLTSAGVMRLRDHMQREIAVREVNDTSARSASGT